MVHAATCKDRRISRLLSTHANTYKMIALSFGRRQARVCTGFRSPVIYRDRGLSPLHSIESNINTMIGT